MNQRESGFVPPIINTRQDTNPQLPAMVQIKTEAEDDTDLSSYGSESDYGSAPKRARYSGGNSNGGSSKSIKSSRINIPDIDPVVYWFVDLWFIGLWFIVYGLLVYSLWFICLLVIMFMVYWFMVYGLWFIGLWFMVDRKSVV